MLRRAVAAGERVGEDFGAHAVDSNGVDGVGDRGGARFEWPEGFAECADGCTGIENDVCTQSHSDFIFNLLQCVEDAACFAARSALCVSQQRRCAQCWRRCVLPAAKAVQ